jgi:hypothetical protein
MTRFQHPFANVYRAVLKEKYPDKAAVISDDSPLNPLDISEDIADEALKRYFSGKKLVIGPRVRAKYTDTNQKQNIKRTITYV